MIKLDINSKLHFVTAIFNPFYFDPVLKVFAECKCIGNPYPDIAHIQDVNEYEILWLMEISSIIF